MNRIMGTVSLLALSALPAAAQEALDLGTITIYAGQTATELSRSGASVEVVTADELAASPSTSLADAIDTLPGVSVSHSGGLGGTTTMRVRGLSGYYLPVLVNGIDVTDPSSTQTMFDWSNLNMGGVNRVELVKGSQSAVHGSEAVGGVINISTTDLDIDGTGGDATVEYGSYNTRRSSLNLHSGNERGGVSFGLSRTSTDGYSAQTTNTENDAYEGTQLTLGAKYALTDTLTLGFDAYAVDSEYDYDGFTSVAATGESSTRAGRIYAEWQTGAVDQSFSVSRYTIDRTLVDAAWTGNYKGLRDRADYKATWNASEGLTLTGGADWTRETYVGTGEVTVKGLFAEANWAASSDMDVTASVRRDDHSGFGVHTTGRVAVAYRLGEGTTLRAQIANGFRAPSLYELYDTWSGNATLTPEESRSYDLGIEHVYANGAAVKATAFYTEVDNLIQYNTTTWAYSQLAGTTKSKGIELSGALPIGERVTLTGNYTYTDSRDASGNRQVRVPKHDLTFGVTAAVTDALDLGLSLQNVRDRLDTTGAMPDYTVINASAAYGISDTWQAYLRVENLADADYQSISGYNTAGRSAYFGIRASF